MKKPQKKQNRLAIVATLLLLVAIPLGILGTQTINDIRNRAADTEKLHFSTDFSESNTTAYIGIPYELKLTLEGTGSSQANIGFGCDLDSCNELCGDIEWDKPQNLDILPGSKTLVWRDPRSEEGKTSWNVLLSASYQDSEGNSTCTYAELPLSVTSKISNDAPQCQILQSHNNLDKVPQNTRTEFILRGTDPDDGISKAQFTVTKDQETVRDLSWEIDNQRNVVINKDDDPGLIFFFEDTGTYSISASMTDASGQTSNCETENTSSLNIVIPGDNGSPEFQTDPYDDSTPGADLEIGEQYSYTVEAEDPEDDAIDYFVINETGWLNFNLNENENGNFSGTFSGTPSQAGSYTVVVSLNDGFHDHYSTQIWVINVDSDTNDTPIVDVTSPTPGTAIQQGQNLQIEWQATDSNLITSFDIFLSTDPANEDTWVPIATGLGYNYNSYIWDTGSTTPGRYYIIVRATDNQSPPAVGQGISAAFDITTGETVIPTQDDDDSTIPDSYPQIKNIRPADKSKTEETKPLISADLFASKNETIEKDSIMIKLDDENITDSTDIRGEEKNEGSIIYTPDEPLNSGTHKVSITFKDSAGRTGQKSWTFTIESPDQAEETTDEDTISILGFKVPKRIALIVAIGLALLILAILIPWLFYAAWRRSSESTSDEYYTTDYYTPPYEPGPPPPSPIATGNTEPQPIQPTPQDSNVEKDTGGASNLYSTAIIPTEPDISPPPTEIEPSGPEQVEPKTEITIDAPPTEPSEPAESTDLQAKQYETPTGQFSPEQPVAQAESESKEEPPIPDLEPPPAPSFSAPTESSDTLDTEKAGTPATPLQQTPSAPREVSESELYDAFKEIGPPEDNTQTQASADDKNQTDETPSKEPQLKSPVKSQKPEGLSIKNLPSDQLNSSEPTPIPPIPPGGIAA
ncbi:hypothetical protein JW710_03505 [Candidatus Dojkabacteria bacterium]|nr:hypothetical protein [Candidatus Dojkabacteria bacterium]